MLKDELQNFLQINIYREPVDYHIIETYQTEHFTRQLISYPGSENDEIRAFLFIPKTTAINGAVLVHHQHHGERHLGKSEVAGITGDPFQHFCPALARAGIISLAPDSICFEDRRRNKTGIEPDDDPDNDWLQHYNEMAYRLLDGKTLMKKVIDDSSIGISLLMHLDGFDKSKVGILGHSYGGNTVIFHSPFDERIRYSCSSGAVCSYKTKFAHDTGIELAEVIPGFTEKYDIQDLLKLIPPREFLIVSATSDIYSQDAMDIFQDLKTGFENTNTQNSFSIKEYDGGHALDQERFDFIVDWFQNKFQR